MVPLVYTVSYNGKTYGPRNSTLTDDGNYEGDFEELNMCFAPITDNIGVSKYSSTIGFMDDIAEGVYDVTVTAPTASGNVERSFKPDCRSCDTDSNTNSRTNGDTDS